MKVIDLATVLISPAVYRAWLEVVSNAVPRLLAAGIDPRQLPDEQGRIEDDGSLTIFVVLPNGGEVSMPVPKGQWAVGIRVIESLRSLARTCSCQTPSLPGRKWLRLLFGTLVSNKGSPT